MSAGARTAAGGSGTARRMWQALETLHMTVYFAPEPAGVLAARYQGAHATLAWPEEDWAAAAAWLRDRGWLEGGGPPFPNPVGLPAPTG
jgi:hypothetical protein